MDSPPGLVSGRVSRLAPGKVNLALHVTGRRSDGYHDIESLAVFTRFGDRLEVAPAESDGFEVNGRYAAGVPDGADNLVVRARDLLRAHAGAAHAPPVGITLEKNLPVASGVGGGSSDAAAVLHALIGLWGLDIGAARLAELALSLGADVPMCLVGRPLVARGVGESLSEIPAFPALGLVLVNPGRPVSTASVFAGLAKRDNGPLPPLPGAFDFHGLRNWLETTRNDMQAAAVAIEPSIGAALDALVRAEAGFARMSGSGATCWGLFETGNVAKRAAASIRARHPDWFVAATRGIASAGLDDKSGDGERPAAARCVALASEA